MRMPRVSTMGRALLLALSVTGSAIAQDASQTSQSGPRFLLARSPSPVVIDLDRSPILTRRIDLDLDGVTREVAIATIARKAGIQLLYGGNLINLDKRVRVRA